jgi:hypothetical protein
MYGAADIAVFDLPPPRRMTAAALPASALMHAALLFAVALLAISEPLTALPLASIAVDLISAQDFAALTQPLATRPPAEKRAPAPAGAPDPERLAPRPAATAPEGQAITATDLLAAGILTDPRNAGLRRALTTLDPTERATQLCNIEALEQIRLAGAGAVPDTVVASAFGDTDLMGTLLHAPGAAFRSDRQWYRVSFDCTVKADYSAVSTFSLTLGAQIPEEQWDEHFLIGEDDEGDTDGG